MKSGHNHVDRECRQWQKLFILWTTLPTLMQTNQTTRPTSLGIFFNKLVNEIPDLGKNFEENFFFYCLSSTSPYVRPLLFYLLDYGVLPQNVSEVGGKKNRDPKVQIITVGHYCNLKMVVSRAQILFVWSPCTIVCRFDGRFKHLASTRLRLQ
jgi:hypothetical protein